MTFTQEYFQNISQCVYGDSMLFVNFIIRKVNVPKLK